MTRFILFQNKVYRFLICSLFLCISSLACALGPQETADSLLIALSKTNDKKEICKIHWRLAAQYKLIDPDEGLKYAGMAIKEAEEIKWDKGIGFGNYELGSNYRVKADYPEALKYMFRALEVGENIQDQKLIGLSLSEIAVIYRHTGKPEKAKLYAKKALKINKDSKNVSGQIQNYNELAIVNVQMSLLDESIENFQNAYDLCIADGQTRNAAVIIGNIGIVYRDKKDYVMAVESFRESAQIHKGLNFEMGVGLSRQNIGDVYLTCYNDSTATNDFNMSRKSLLDSAIYYISLSIPTFEQYDALSDILSSHEKLSEIYVLKKDYKNAYLNYKKYIVLKDSIDSNDDKVKLANLGEERAELEKSQQEKLTKKQEQLTSLSEEKRRNETIAFIVGLIVLSIFTVFIFRERRKSERLLLNILPRSVAAELKKKGISEAQLYNNVTVLFTDFVGFTSVSERLTPKELVSELDTCFRVFDQIMGRHNIEKIKTVGDAYLAVCGLPEEDPQHAQNVVNAGVDIVKFMKERKKIIGENTFEIRVGIHSGNVVAGIVGVKKFAYDIWGDTVNTAARMEQNSEPGRINVSASTQELVKDEFECRYRGEIAAKNKGKLAMYFIEGEVEKEG